MPNTAAAVASQPQAKKKNDDEIAHEIIKEYNYEAGKRGVWESHWEEIALRMMPASSRLFQSRGFRTPGEKRNEYVLDSTAPLALSKFGAILDSLLTPRNQKWHKLRASDKNLNKNRQISLWFDEVNDILFNFRYAPKANFSSQNQKNYKSLGAFGTGCMFIDELVGDPGLRYRAVHLAEIFFSENHQGIVERAYRYFPLTARQAWEQFGNSCPDNIKGALADSPNKEFFFIHCVKPRKEYNQDARDSKNMPIASYYVSMDSQKLVKEGGFASFPYAISRYEQEPGEVYGRSPAMDVLPAVKTLNEEKRILLKQGHRAVDPVLLAHDDGIVSSFSLRPGAINAGGVTADGRPLVHALPVGQFQIGKELMDDERNVINDAFLITLFQILTETPQMTATEVMERTKEKGILLAPTIGRQQSEYLGPMIEREIDLLSRQGLLPPMPDMLKEAQGEYSIQYESPLSRAQRAEEAAGFQRLVEQGLAIFGATQNPEVLDYLDFDESTPAMAEIHGVPPKWVKTKEMVEAARAARAEQAQTQTMIQGAPAAAAMVKAMGSVQKGK